MTPDTFRVPNVSVLPFETFRTFGPVFDKPWPFTAWTPPCDIYETDTAIVLKMELPEMRKEDVRVILDNNVLTLRGERKFDETITRENYHRVERKYGEFIRIFSLPKFVDGTKVMAEFKEGMLTVTLPKNATAMPRQIEVKVM
jgi:HSP20 family protein